MGAVEAVTMITILQLKSNTVLIRDGSPDINLNLNGKF